MQRVPSATATATPPALHRRRLSLRRRVAAWAGAATMTVGGVAALAAVELAAVVAPASPAAADPIGSCTTTTGVIVVVDFRPWGGAVTRGCDATPTTGYQALLTAEFTPAGDSQDGPAYICRIGLTGVIGDEPPPSQDPCVTTPPASATWSYWHANAGQSTWTYSMLGAMSYHPLPGSVDAWTFGAAGPNSQPSFAPSAVRATNPGPPVTAPTTAPAPGAPGAPTTTVASPATAGTGTGSGTGSGTSASASAPPTSASGSPSSTTEPGPRSKLRIADVAPVSARGHPSGSPLPLMVGAAVVVVLAGSGGIVAWRRRQHRAG
ncbi:MAG TPA: hypothetical protein VMU76_06255 [Acidimicrobiales bacterium]|nr:hypothetical protein [Acidimicrobiales bacterium]